ncbi:MAG: PAS domain S-box protein [Desulfocapsaceae bacterium]|nr:PAS domain S-box protein [Desulfocapsaceae bacterium]
MPFKFKDQTGRIKTATQKAEAAVSESDNSGEEALYRILFEQSGAALYLHDLSGTILNANTAASEQTGYSREELLTMEIFDLHPDNAADKEQLIRIWRSWQVGEYQNHSAEHRRKDGTVFPVELTTSVVSGGGQNCILVTAIAGKRKKASKESLLESEVKYRALFEKAPIGYQSLNEQGRIIEVNQAWIDMLGYTHAEVVGRSFGDFLPPEWQQHFQENFPRFKAVGEILGVEFEMIKKDGSTILVSFNGKISRDSGGHFQQTHCVLDNITEKRRTEKKIEESEQRFKLLAENLPDVFYRMSLPDGQYEYMSPASAELFGYDPEEWYTTPMLVKDIIHPEYHDYFQEKWQQLLQGELSPTYEYKIIHRNGDIRWLNQRNVGHWNSNGELVAMEGIVTDITERKKAELALQKSEERFRKIIERSPLPMLITDHQQNIIFCNNKFSELFGYTINDVRTADEWWHAAYPDEDYRSMVRQSWTAAVEEARLQSTEIEMQEREFTIKDGTKRTAEFHMVPLGDIGLTIINDISERKRIENDLKITQAAIENSLNGFDVVGENGLFLYVNKSYVEMWGYESAEEIIGTSPADHCHDPIMVEKIISELRENGEYEFEFKAKRKDGSLFDVLMYARLAHDEHGNEIYSGTSVDITEKKLLEEKLQQAQKLESIGNLAGGIAHEFNNILSIIMGNNELVMEDLPEWSFARESAEEIRNAGLRARDVVKQLLTFSRRDSVTKRVFEIREVIGDSLKLLQATIPKSIAIETELAESVHPIYGSETQLNQVLINLCKNSADAIVTGVGTISISLHNCDGQDDDGSYQVCLKVSDTGIGMSKELCKHIFDPYFTTKEVGKGTGIGLSVVHGIVESHGGTIEVDSTPQQGTTFTILLPAAEKTATIESSAGTPVDMGKEHLLLVDDEESLCRMNKRLLQSLGYTITTCNDPVVALDLFSTNPHDFDGVISDMAMPRMTGEKLLTEILKMREDIPTILCTGFSETLSERQARQLGIKAYLLKPVDSQKLAATIRRVIDSCSKE